MHNALKNNLATKIFLLFDKKEKKSLFYILLLVTIMGLFEFIGVAAILPFVALMIDPTVVEQNQFLKYVYDSLNFKSYNLFFISVGLFLLIINTISFAFKLVTNYTLNVWSHTREHSIGNRLLSYYLNKEYHWFLNKHTTELGKTLLSEVSSVIHLGIRPLIIIVSQSVIILFLLSLTIIVNPLIACSSLLAMSLIYFTIYKIISRQLDKIGEKRYLYNELRYSIIDDCFSAIKLVKLSSNENSWISKFSSYNYKYCKTQAFSDIISTSPRFLLELVLVFSVLCSLFYLSFNGDSLTIYFPSIILFAFTSVKIIPSAQQIYTSFSKLKFAKNAINRIYDDLNGFSESMFCFSNKHFIYKKSIILRNICFHYDSNPSVVLNNINITLNKNECVGIIGKSGSGKSTLIDLLIGLLKPTKGQILVDGVEINSFISSWKKIIGYVPQDIYLSDKTIAENIAFGLDEGCFSEEKILRAAKASDIHDFITNDLENGYNTKVGQRGVRLSGGQRQRIGIARALYNDPEIIVFDEATSALDCDTELLVMESIEKLSSIKTIIIIAHRFTTLKKCDNIYMLNNGIISHSGDYNYFSKNNLFQSLPVKT